MGCKKKGTGKFVLGAALGAGLGVLFAPKAGSETRKELKAKMDELLAKLKEIDVAEVKENIEAKIFELRTELDELDKETVLKIAKSKANDLKDKATELASYAVEKGTPVLQNAAEQLKEKTIQVTKEIIEKLENKEEKKDKKNKKKEK